MGRCFPSRDLDLTLQAMVIVSGSPSRSEYHAGFSFGRRSGTRMDRQRAFRGFMSGVGLFAGQICAARLGVAGCGDPEFLRGWAVVQGSWKAWPWESRSLRRLGRPADMSRLTGLLVHAATFSRGWLCDPATCDLPICTAYGRGGGRAWMAFRSWEDQADRMEEIYNSVRRLTCKSLAGI